MSPSNMIIPAICAYSKNFSEGLRLVTISYNVNKTCPPSNAGMGNIFMKARITESMAVSFQNDSQSHTGANMDPMDLNPPTPL